MDDQVQKIRAIFTNCKSNGAVLGNNSQFYDTVPPASSKEWKKHFLHNELTEAKRARRKYTPTRN